MVAVEQLLAISKSMRQAMDEHQMNGSPSMSDIEEQIGEMSKGSRAIFLGDDSSPVKKRRSRRFKIITVRIN